MRKTVALTLTLVVALVGTPVGAFAAAAKRKPAGQSTQGGTLAGIARDASQKVLSGVVVQVRDRNGALVATSTTVGNGGFSFAGLAPGSYTLELVDAAGNIIGTSAAVSVVAGGTALVTVTATAVGTIAAAAGGGLALLGLGTVGTAALIGGAAAAGIVGYTVSKKDASPSR
jgi:hypothetical protein